MSRLARRISRLHKILGLVVGLQVFFWVLSGLFFTLYPIETIRGDPWRPVIAHGSLETMPVTLAPEEAARGVDGDWRAAELRAFLNRPVWIITTSKTRVMVDAETGAHWSPLDPVAFRAVQRALSDATGRSAVPGPDSVVTYITDSPPREYGGALPAWAIEDVDTGRRIYFDATTGELHAVRTPRWRIFDILWRFHIMDITGSDRVDSWWLKLFAFFALSMVLSGFVLLVDRARKGRLLA